MFWKHCPACYFLRFIVILIIFRTIVKNFKTAIVDLQGFLPKPYLTINTLVVLNSLKLRINRSGLLLTILFSALSLVSNDTYATVEEGKQLYQANCAKCHMIDRKMTGPALQGVRERWPDSTNLYSWIRNSQAFLATGDEYANKLYLEYNKSQMQAFPNLTDADISNILAYIDDEAKKIAEAALANSSGGGATVTAEPKDNTVLYIILVAVLLIISIILSRTLGFLNRLHREKENEPEPVSVPVLKNKRIRPVLTLIGLFVFCWLCYSMYDSASALGRQQGYAPEQPIKFSHEIHAGINQIDCRYCHSGVEKGKSAVLPSINVCMNCHYNIQAMSPGNPDYPAAEYTAEIQKIYDYAGFDPENLTYSKEPKPIQWVKIHNTPDHVYFNHSQHVKVGGLECQTCHGMVQEMKVVEQAENLSMGWCINCHRQTEVNFSNGFYADYRELKEKMDSGEIDVVHASDIGATECQRCHY